MKFKPLLFVVTLVALLAFQSKVVIPYLYEIAASDFFLEDTGDEANRLSSSNLMTNTAFNQCNNYIANEVLPDHTIKFAKNPINAFSLGSFSYVINADLDIQPADSASFTRRYVCRIKYHGDDSTGSTAPEDWSIDGFSGLDNI